MKLIQISLLVCSLLVFGELQLVHGAGEPATTTATTTYRQFINGIVPMFTDHDSGWFTKIFHFLKVVQQHKDNKAQKCEDVLNILFTFDTEYIATFAQYHGSSLVFTVSHDLEYMLGTVIGTYFSGAVHSIQTSFTEWSGNATVFRLQVATFVALAPHLSDEMISFQREYNEWNKVLGKGHFYNVKDCLSYFLAAQDGINLNVNFKLISLAAKRRAYLEKEVETARLTNSIISYNEGIHNALDALLKESTLIICQMNADLQELIIEISRFHVNRGIIGPFIMHEYSAELKIDHDDVPAESKNPFSKFQRVVKCPKVQQRPTAAHVRVA